VILAELVRSRAAGGKVVTLAEDVGFAVNLFEDLHLTGGDGRFAVCGCVGEEVLAGVGVRAGDSLRVGNDIGDRLRQLGVLLGIYIVRAGDVAVAQRGAQTVGEIGDVSAGDEGVLERLLLLLGERQQCGLLNRACLDAAGDAVVCAESRSALSGAGECGDWSESCEHILNRGRLSPSREGTERIGCRHNPSCFVRH